ncbi:MAG TPA: hypothetical protein VIH57_21020, partial [Bacteroidales bacterium]
MIMFVKRLIISLLSSLIFFNIHANILIEDDTISTSIEAKISKIDTLSHIELYTTFLSKVSYIGRYYGTS